MTRQFNTTDTKALFSNQLQDVPEFVLEPLLHCIFNRWSKYLSSLVDSDITDICDVNDLCVVVWGKIIKVDYRKSYFLHTVGYKDQAFIYNLRFEGEEKRIARLIENLKNFVEQNGLENLKRQAGTLLNGDCLCERHHEVYKFYSVAPELPCPVQG